jgi:Alkali metal cation/H+ antiporter Nha1 C terminus
VFTLGKRLNTLSFTITYTQDNATTQASAHSVGAIAARFPRLSITSRKPPKAVRKEDISAPRDGHPLNADTLLGQGGPISMSAIGRTDITVETAPEATRRREARRAELGEFHRSGGGEEVTEETLDEKVNDGEQAWRDGDEIFIENEEGEIIRQISSPRHPAGEMKYPDEEGRLTDRLKRMWSGGSHKSSRSPERARTPRALEEAIPEESHVQEKDFASAEQSSVSSETETPPRGAQKPAVVGPVIVVDEDNRLAPSISPREARRAREERDEETEVERRRREAIFGGIADDSDDEDRPIRHRGNKGKSPAQAIVSPPSPLMSAVVDSDDEDGGDDERSPSGSSGNAESSTSGTGLLSPPARTRGIRFGDINVGTASFSLEEGPPSTGGPTAHRRTGSSSSRVRWNK